MQGWAAILMGVISRSIPWYTMMILHDKLPFLKQIDDPMAVFHTHAVPALSAVPKLCRLFYWFDFFIVLSDACCLSVLPHTPLKLYSRCYAWPNPSSTWSPIGKNTLGWPMASRTMQLMRVYNVCQANKTEETLTIGSNFQSNLYWLAWK